MKLQGTMSKLMEQVFKPIDTVVWDLSTGLAPVSLKSRFTPGSGPG